MIVDGVEELVEAADLERDTFDFGSALRTELEWLNTNEIISSIDDGTLAEIAAAAGAGIAGWNSRIAHEAGKWIPYDQTKEPVLIRTIDCSGFELDRLLYDETIILPSASSVAANGKLATQWGRTKAGL